MFYCFVWKNGPVKVKRNILTQNYDKGGMRMVDLNNFCKAMKINWLKKLISNNKYCELVKEMCPISIHFSYLGPAFVAQNINQIENPFWKNVLQSYVILNSKIKIKTWEELKMQPLWYNPLFQI